MTITTELLHACRDLRCAPIGKRHVRCRDDYTLPSGEWHHVEPGCQFLVSVANRDVTVTRIA